MAFDLSRLGAWRALPFFDKVLPGIEAALCPGFLPPRDKVFAALERTQPQDVRVVILGQDPYHRPGKADGLAFSIPRNFGGRLDSLGNVFREIETDLGAPRRVTDLSDWADQGVLLLNTILTVPAGQAKGHKGLGWEMLVPQVLAMLADRDRAYLLWGRDAHVAARPVDAVRNLKIETPHPSPLSAHRGFLGSRPFCRTNAWLQARNMPAINWTDPRR